MKIASASIDMQSNHMSAQRLQVSERLEMWRDPPVGRGAANRVQGPDTVRLSDDGLAAQQTDAAEAGMDELETDPRLSVLIRMIEQLTGRPVRIFRMSDLTGEGGAPVSAPRNGSPAPDGRAGFGVEYDFDAHYSESERTSFAAQGIVRTSDGAEIRFSIGFSMERSYSESMSVRLRAGDARLKDPLILDFGGASTALSDLRFEFDLDADGTKESIPLAGGTGFLAFDRNGNGRVDDGSELFGPATGNGFAELAALDEDGNGWIDENDPAFGSLKVWSPDAQGKGRVLGLAESGIGALYLANVATPFSVRDSANQTLGEMRASSIYLREDGGVGSISQVDLSV